MKEKSTASNTPEQDQDNGWKEMLDAFFEEFVEFFFLAIHADIDWRRGYESLDKELAQLGREHATGKRIADKLVRVWLKDGRETWLLIHVEIQGRPEKQFNERTYIYNYRIFDKHHCEVVSLVVVTGRGGGGVGTYETGRWGFRLSCKFPVARIAEYRGREAELHAVRNPFALVVLAQLRLLDAKGDPQKRMAAKRELIRGLLRGGRNRAYVIGLLRFLDWVMVLPPELNEQLKYELEKEQKKMPYITTWELMGYERGLSKGTEQGLEQGLEQGEKRLVIRQLQRRCGEIDERLVKRINRLSLEQVEELSDALFDFSSLQDLKRWLREFGKARTQ